jgi:hypothetical protein
MSDTPRTDAVARWGCVRDDFARQLEREIIKLKQWKEEAISVIPDFQAIGNVLGLPIGSPVHERILPSIINLKSLAESHGKLAHDNAIKLASMTAQRDAALWLLNTEGETEWWVGLCDLENFCGPFQTREQAQEWIDKQPNKQNLYLKSITTKRHDNQ